jgi:hypothetical protein
VLSCFRYTIYTDLDNGVYMLDQSVPSSSGSIPPLLGLSFNHEQFIRIWQ